MILKTSFCITGLLFVSMGALDGTALSQVQPKLSVGVQNFEDYAPYSSYINDEYGGFNRELLDAYARASSRSLAYKAMPIRRLYHSFIIGEVELKYPDNPNWSKDLKKGHDIYYSHPVVSFIDGVAVLSNRLNPPKKQLKRLGMIAGYTPKPYIDDIRKGRIRLLEVKTMSSLVRLLTSERVDGIYTNMAVLNSFLHQNPQKAHAISFDPSLPYLEDFRHLSTKDNAFVIHDFNRFLSDNQALIQHLKAKHNLLDAQDLLNANSNHPIH